MFISNLLMAAICRVWDYDREVGVGFLGGNEEDAVLLNYWQVFGLVCFLTWLLILLNFKWTWTWEDHNINELYLKLALKTLGPSIHLTRRHGTMNCELDSDVSPLLRCTLLSSSLFLDLTAISGILWRQYLLLLAFQCHMIVNAAWLNHLQFWIWIPQ